MGRHNHPTRTSLPRRAKSGEFLTSAGGRLTGRARRDFLAARALDSARITASLTTHVAEQPAPVPTLRVVQFDQFDAAAQADFDAAARADFLADEQADYTAALARFDQDDLAVSA